MRSRAAVSTWSSIRWAGATVSPPSGPPDTWGGSACIGFASGPIASIPLNQVLLNNRTVVGVDWGGWTFKDPFGNRELIGELMDLVGAGRLHPARPATYPLDDAARGDVRARRPVHRGQGGAGSLTDRRPSRRVS